MTLRAKKGFSLVELVVVIVIIGILAAIAIPRLSRGATGASQSAVAANLATMRQAIAMYVTEHNGNFPGPDETGFKNKLTVYTDVQGNVSPDGKKSTTYRFGPYVPAIPACTVGENAGTTTANKVLIDSTNTPPTPVTTGGEGWVYNPTTGEFLPNTTMTDDSGKAYNTY
jgi:prepilin-type N-terminal cleavage/methylation domain-containing protein